jgi:hypothetical protein
MNIRTNAPCGVLGQSKFRTFHRREQAFTLIEAMMVLLLSVMLIGSAISLCLVMNYNSARQAYYTAAMSIVEGGIADLRAFPYNPPNYPFQASTLVLTNANYPIRLGQDGTNLVIPGAVYSTIQPLGTYQHMITVMWTNALPGQPADPVPMSVSLQSIVNRYSAGQNFQK